jgi:pimeloyl-ACP methyl ester carboxylesterase
MALAAYDALRREHPDKPIFVSGFSMGTTASLYLAVHRPVTGLLLHNPPPLRQVIMGRYGWWNLWLLAGPIALQIPADLDSLANARQLKVPAVFVISGNDEVVPPAYQRKVADAYAGPKQIITAQAASHNTPFTEETETQVREQINWLWAEAGQKLRTPAIRHPDTNAR